MRRKANSVGDKKRFTRTATKTKLANITKSIPRGGYRM